MNTWDVFFEFAARARFGVAECAKFNSDLKPVLRIEQRERSSAPARGDSDPDMSPDTARVLPPDENDGLRSLLAQYLLYRF